ncbi:MAG: glutamate--tRNA ligase [Patescibacteria group bacterium]|nr:glutamate--tRNA ligase [Patescibacteria group bacterium]
MSSTTRTRFAPSPTGPLHMGSVRTALFNYLFAKQNKGKFILRIEDTDKERSAKEWEGDIIEQLSWLGLKWDEGPDKEGSYGPYRQSERTELYKTYLQKLLDDKNAYHCFCTGEELEAHRQEQTSRGETPKYSGRCREISETEQKEKLKAGNNGVIRFVVEPKKVTFKDLIRGKIEFDMSLSGDIVIAKDLDTPLYNFSVVVDDSEMAISHVIRGEDHISNTPRQILIAEALAFTIPEYAHLPLLLGEDRSKLSKRHGNNSVKRFREEGYLPEAILNFLALLGWNPGDEREIFSLKDLVKEFKTERVQKGGAVFNLKRLDWINARYLKEKSVSELAQDAVPFFETAGFTPKDKKTTEKIVALYKERMHKIAEIAEYAGFFFQDFLKYDKELLSWKGSDSETTKAMLKKAESILIEVKDWKEETIEKVLMEAAEKEENRGLLLWPLRVALTGQKSSPSPFEVADVLGKEATLQRIKEATNKL